MNRKNLIINGILKILLTVTLLSILLFIPAGTYIYPGAWRMMLILTIPMIILGTYLFVKNPDLLAKRLKSKEKEIDQKEVILFSALVFIVCFVLCGLDFRFGWSKVPTIVVYIGCAVFLLTYLGFCELLRENDFLSRTIEVQDNQRVVSNGLYGIVRHPMYSIIFFMFISIPLIIGSFVALIPLVFIPYILVKRIVNEEKVLEEGLNGYSEYKQKVKYRLVPFIW